MQAPDQPANDVLAVLALIAIVAISAPVARPRAWFGDFNAFYCAGRTIAAGRDPYRTQPLGACEARPKPAGFFVATKNVSLPAPLPPYALAPFVPLSALPYVTAAAFWMILLLTMLWGTIEAMHRITQLPRAVLFAAFAPIEGLSSIFLGETAPIAIAAIAIAAALVRRGEPSLAAWSLAPATLEPHVALPAMLALFVCARAARPALAAIAVVCALVSLASVGFVTSAEYLARILPAHARSEIDSTQQFSLTGLLHIARVPDALALNAGSASYVMMLLASAVFARALARRDARDALIVALPAAFAVTGGVFIHITQLPAAMPAGLLAFVRTHGAVRKMTGIAIVLLAFPWCQFLGLIAIPLAAGVVFVLARNLLEETPAFVAGSSLAAALGILAFDLIFILGPRYPTLHFPPLRPYDLAETSWAAYVHAVNAPHPLVRALARVPSWFGIATIAAVLVHLATRTGPAARYGLWEHGAKLKLRGTAPGA